jgi:hypothetical protein
MCGHRDEAGGRRRRGVGCVDDPDRGGDTVALGSQLHMHVHLAWSVHHPITGSEVDAHDACPDVSKRLDSKHEPQNHCRRCHPRRELVRSAHCVPVAQNGANLAKLLGCPIELIRQTPSADLNGVNEEARTYPHARVRANHEQLRKAAV